MCFIINFLVFFFFDRAELLFYLYQANTRGGVVSVVVALSGMVTTFGAHFKTTKKNIVGLFLFLCFFSLCKISWTENSFLFLALVQCPSPSITRVLFILHRLRRRGKPPRKKIDIQRRTDREQKCWER
jgi:hypothetical protein